MLRVTELTQSSVYRSAEHWQVVFCTGLDNFEAFFAISFRSVSPAGPHKVLTSGICGSGALPVSPACGCGEPRSNLARGAAEPASAARRGRPHYPTLASDPSS